MVITGAIVAVYYNMLIAYAFYFMMASFVRMDDSVPWKYCDNDWNTPFCRRESFPDLESDAEVNSSMKLPVLWDVFYNKTCVSDLLNATTYADFTNGSSVAFDKFLAEYLERFPNSSASVNTLAWYEVKDYSGFDVCERQYTTPSEEYFERAVLGLQNSSGFDDLGDFSVKLVCSLALSWLLIFACVLKGIKTSGKVVYFSALFPYFVLTALLIKGLTLDGSEDGIDFYIVPEWHKLKNADVWGDAANQIFYSLGIGFGSQLTMASYNKFRNNCLHDAILVAFINCGTSVYAGFAIFSLLGHMAHVTGKEVEDVATSGPGLAFVAYPDGISRLSSSSVWGFLFFFMLITLGMDSQFMIVITAVRQEGSEYNDEDFPDWADAIGWASCSIPILVLFIVTLLQMRKFGWPGCIRPTSTWGPSLASDRTGRYASLLAGMEETETEGEAVHLSSSAIITSPHCDISMSPCKTTDNVNGYGACQNGNIYDVPSH
ncbi:transporter [Elysia marginata]|uniref:Transporter n=1 Tax=Elysia marginata TaxID=1093978 RepID=A0AAV4HSX0_9GAST|nr:transporter [Elysia marginata]